MFLKRWIFLRLVLLVGFSTLIVQHMYLFLFRNHIVKSSENSGYDASVVATKIKRALDINSVHYDKGFYFNIWPFVKTRSHEFKRDRRVTRVDCGKLFQGDMEEGNKATRWSAILDFMPRNESKFLEMTKDCKKFVHDRDYIMSSLTEEEENFPIAYSISLYHEVEQFEKLLRAIYRPQNYYCIHVDKKSADIVFDATKAIASCFPNVFLASKRLPVIWADINVLKSNLECANDLYRQSNRWRYFITLAGQEFPLKTNYQIVKILKALNGSNNVEGVENRKVELRREFEEEPPYDVHLVKGSVNIAVTRGFVEFMLFDKKGQNLLDWIGYTNIPDESFFSTLNYNSHLRVPGSPTELNHSDPLPGMPELNRSDPILNPFLARFSNWHFFPCHGKYVRQVCIFGFRDLPFLIKRPEIIANKFHWDYQRAGLECMDEYIYNQTRDEYIEKRVFNASWPRKFSIHHPRR